MSRRLPIVVLMLLFVTSFAVTGASRKALPPAGIVPDERTAVRIAEVVFQPIFGEEEVAKFAPYHAHLKDGVWRSTAL